MSASFSTAFDAIREPGQGTTGTVADAEGHNGDLAFRRYYIEQVNNNLQVLEGHLRRLEAEHDAKSVEEIASAAERLRDLAMVHGYEAVEAIAMKVERALAPWRFLPSPLPADLRQKLHEAVKALHTVIALTDESEEQAVVERTGAAIPPLAERPLPSPPPLRPPSTQPEARPESFTTESQRSIETEEEEELRFDIKEGDLLVSLMSEEDDESSSTDDGLSRAAREHRSNEANGRRLERTFPSRSEHQEGTEEDRIAHKQIRRKWMPRRRFRFDL